MRIAVSRLHRGNVGQTITVDQIDDDAGSEVVITGTLSAIERGPDTFTLTVGIHEYELEPTDTVDIVRSTVLEWLVKAGARSPYA